MKRVHHVVLWCLFTVGCGDSADTSFLEQSWGQPEQGAQPACLPGTVINGKAELLTLLAQLTNRQTPNEGISNDVLVEGDSIISTADLDRPNDTTGIALTRYFLIDPIPLPNVICLEQATTGCRTIRIHDAPIRLRRIRSPLSDLDYVEVYRPCGVPCTRGERRCAKDRTCRKFEDYCLRCDGHGVAYCTCHTADGPKPDGSPCRFAAGVDGPVFDGRCTGGACVAKP